MNNPLNIIAFSYAKQTLLVGSRERERMVKYGTVFGIYHVIVFTNKTEQYAACVQEGNVCFHATNSNHKIGMVIDAYRIGRNIIKRQRQKKWIVSAQDPFASSLPALVLSLSRGVILHVQIHGDIFNKHFFERSLLSVCKHWYAIFVLKRAVKIRVVSERIKNSLLERGVSSEKITVLPVQSDMQTFFKVGGQRSYRAADEVKFLYVGRFAQEKNLRFLIRAFAQAKREGMKGTLSLLGSGPTKSSLESEIQSLKVGESVYFLPWSNDVAAVMGETDVLCLSSLHEGYAMVLHEAMASGLPLLTTDVGCAGDVVRDSKEGFVVPVYDTIKYVEAFKKLSQDQVLRERYGRSAFARIQTRILSGDDYLHELIQSFKV
jgi:glycosyltransferase involved in cell wall biosynthesis